ncbi:hypothetical protein A0H81_12100 [Grifola frondosa]|uniref:Uncharacterized protein n=1 Tax=Grifola frondosa TaxID=5627 RepID=A0A1C7LV64_GRIFR|nr:hypothetical protein A0H81_12100 [Grifola frondosa]
MLLSPPLARVWTPKIKRIIRTRFIPSDNRKWSGLGANHSFSSVSYYRTFATIGEPEKFNSWLKSVQEAHGKTRLHSPSPSLLPSSQVHLCPPRRTADEI